MDNSKNPNGVLKGWSITDVYDARVFFENVGTFLPEDAVLALEEGDMAQDVLAFVQLHEIAPQARLTHGTLWPPSRMHHLRPTADVLGGLAELSAHHAEPEICDHIYVYTG